MVFNMLRVFLGVCLMEIITIEYLDAAPNPSARVQWATPCTPNLQSLPSNQNGRLPTLNGNTDENVIILKSKTEDAIQVGKVIEKIVTDIFQDNNAKKMIRAKNLNGFPQAVLGAQKESIGETFRNIYTQLSKSAVFLDHVYHVQSEGELKNQLEDIVSNNLSLMCELQFVMVKVGANRPDPANRSIIGDLPQTMSSFQKNELCLNTIFKYEALLSKHLQWYREIRANSDD